MVKLQIGAVIAVLLIAGCSKGGVDLYDALLARTGMSAYDPKPVSVQVLASCSIEGRPASLGVVKYSYNMMKLSGINQRTDFGPMYVAARKESDGRVITMIADAEDEAQVGALKERWVSFWGCKI